ncbi:MAG TPA: hypothetical protein EYP39_01095 [Ghiorsea sp.]|nr:hypothetical protein [Ghiorsea sp.]
MARSKSSRRTVVSKTIFCTNRKNYIHIDGTVVKTNISTENGKVANYETGYSIALHNHEHKDREDAVVYLDPSTALAMASHILDQLAGVVEGSFETLIGNGGNHTLIAGRLNQREGVSIIIGPIETFVELGANGLRGFAELMKVVVSNVEAKMIDAKSKDDYKKWQASQKTRVDND